MTVRVRKRRRRVTERSKEEDYEPKRFRHLFDSFVFSFLLMNSLDGQVDGTALYTCANSEINQSKSNPKGPFAKLN